MREYKVIFGHINKGMTKDGILYANVMKICDVMILPEFLLHIIPQRMVKEKQFSNATDFVIVGYDDNETKEIITFDQH